MEGYVYQVVFNNDYFSKGKSDFIFFLFEIFLDVTCSLGEKTKTHYNLLQRKNLEFQAWREIPNKEFQRKIKHSITTK